MLVLLGVGRRVAIRPVPSAETRETYQILLQKKTGLPLRFCPARSYGYICDRTESTNALVPPLLFCIGSLGKKEKKRIVDQVAIET